jgi:hypothetical protein
MRILITHPSPLDGPTGSAAEQLTSALRQSGHEVHLLLVDRADADQPGSTQTRRVSCQAGNAAADLDFDIPRFESEPGARQTYAALSDEQLSRYREVLRRELDREVDAFDPHMIHVEYVWLLGQLVLETGAPYVARAWGPELTSSLRIPRIRSLAQQAAENAGRILVGDRALGDAVRKTFDVATERIVVLPPGQSSIQTLVQLYQTVLDERFGTLPG